MLDFYLFYPWLWFTLYSSSSTLVCFHQQVADSDNQLSLIITGLTPRWPCVEGQLSPERQDGFSKWDPNQKSGGFQPPPVHLSI